eukprot:2855433-Amphidinium_carterae.1
MGSWKGACQWLVLLEAVKVLHLRLTYLWMCSSQINPAVIEQRGCTTDVVLHFVGPEFRVLCAQIFAEESLKLTENINNTTN